MKDEIKEIQERLNYHKAIGIEPEYCEDLITTGELQIILDYITRLEEENEHFRTQVNTYENPDDYTLFYMWLDAKAKDKMKQLQQENETLNSRINKAIEYIKSIKYMNCRYFDYNKWRKNTPYGSIEELHEKIKKDGTLEGHFVEVNRDIIFNILNGGDEE